MTDRFMVYVSCMTYNQSEYIIDALDGFCMQQTDFPFVCGIIDDASTEGEPDVIQHYLEEHFDFSDTSVVRRDETDDFFRVFVQHKTNKNCFFAVVYLKYNHYRKKSKESYVSEWKDGAKYVALCEGDDYWIDPQKLQKQVLFLEEHPKHSLCFCSHKELLPTGVFYDVKRYDSDVEFCSIDEMIAGGGGFMATNSMLYRNSLYTPYQTWAIGCPVGDLPLMLTLAINGKVGYLSDVMCVHRDYATGSWRSSMSSSIQKRRKHSLQIVKMWKQFDKWSDRRYHQLVKSRIRFIKKNRIKDELATLVNRVLKLVK